MRRVGFAAWLRPETRACGVSTFTASPSAGTCPTPPPARSRRTGRVRRARRRGRKRPDPQANLGIPPTTWEAYLESKRARSGSVSVKLGTLLRREPPGRRGPRGRSSRGRLRYSGTRVVVDPDVRGGGVAARREPGHADPSRVGPVEADRPGRVGLPAALARGRRRAGHDGARASRMRGARRPVTSGTRRPELVRPWGVDVDPREAAPLPVVVDGGTPTGPVRVPVRVVEGAGRWPTCQSHGRAGHR